MWNERKLIKKLEKKTLMKCEVDSFLYRLEVRHFHGVHSETDLGPLNQISFNTNSNTALQYICY